MRMELPGQVAVAPRRQTSARVAAAVAGAAWPPLILTTLLIFGVGFLPVAVMVGISYALWAGLCAAFIAYEPQGEAPDRMNRVVRRTI